MVNIAIVICTRKESRKYLYNRLIRSIYNGTFLRSKKKEIIEAIKVIELYENFTLHLIGLPFSIKDLEMLNKHKIERHISEICMDRNIDNCIIPSDVYNSSEMIKHTENPYSGRFLFKSLLTKILEEIYSNRGIRIGELDILIIKGEDDTELYSIIRQISPLVKYLNIYSDNKDVYQNQIDDIFGDFGLSIGITEELNSSAKNADIIINLRSSFDNIKKIRSKPNSVIINYGLKEASKFFENGNLINGIEVGLPKKTFGWIDENIRSYFTDTQIAEIILCHKTGLQGKAVLGTIDERTAAILLKEFISGSFRISGFTGRYGTIKTGDVNCI